ncbi:MAG TPA: hypothetical protein VGO55_01700 [Allosphingosinicella sp.]|jgi:hypothetical protein|nr:hypothetical protein [Allosphingosinicella sp.]
MIAVALAAALAVAAQASADAQAPAEFVAGRGALGGWRMEAVTVVETWEPPPTIGNGRCTIRGRGLRLVVPRDYGGSLEIGGNGLPFAMSDIAAIDLGGRVYETQMRPLPFPRARCFPSLARAIATSLTRRTMSIRPAPGRSRPRSACGSGPTIPGSTSPGCSTTCWRCAASASATGHAAAKRGHGCRSPG